MNSQPKDRTPACEVIDLARLLREEANLVHGTKINGETPANLYRQLNAQNSAALCLSGGGIRSAAFGLGVIQALAKHPCEAGQHCAEKSDDSLLRRFDYVSTVSGGGYIGSWFSAWLHRKEDTTFDDVWARLLSRPSGSDREPEQIQNLRRYSNYLTPRIGAMSSDSWAAVALYVRNLSLNWLVVVPPVCAILLLLKLFAALVASLWRGGESLQFVSVLAPYGALGFLVVALAYTHLNRPTRNALNWGQPQFLWFALFPAVLSGGEWAALVVTPGFLQRVRDWFPWLLQFDMWDAHLADLDRCLNLNESLQLAKGCAEDLWRDAARLSRAGLLLAGAAAGSAIYVVAWLLGRLLSVRQSARTSSARDFLASFLSGATYGVVLAYGTWLLLYFNIEFHAIHPSLKLFAILGLGMPWALLALLTAEGVFVGFTSYQSNSDEDREWFGRADGWYAVIGLAWIATVFLAYFGSYFAASLGAKFHAALSAVGGASGFITLLLGKSARVAANTDQGASPLKTWIIDNVFTVITPIFVAALLILLSDVLDRLVLQGSFLDSALLKIMPREDPKLTPTEWSDAVAQWRTNKSLDLFRLWVWTLIFSVVAIVAWCGINVNRFSLHSLYRNRLIREFLGASNLDRQPNRFTDFARTDNLHVHQLWSRAKPRPFHVINMALNVVAGENLAWQERKAESFTVTAAHSGSGKLNAYRDSFYYGGSATGRDGGITLGTAMAISGAAVSPNMGYHSSPAVTFLMALFNVRLGSWLGNPSKETFRRDGPRFAIRPFIDELFGLTTDDHPYVYLSDGGHFENLGLYEMVRRRCRFIVISDAGCDPKFTFEDLGNAVRKIEIDLGVRVTFYKLEELKPRSKGGEEIDAPYHAIGEIDYPQADGAGKRGIILYVKPSYHAVEKNVGVRSYAMAHSDFPHETTVNQWFSESQFESYRALGFEIMDQLFDGIVDTPTPPSDAPKTLEIILEKLLARAAKTTSGGQQPPSAVSATHSPKK